MSKIKKFISDMKKELDKIKLNGRKIYDKYFEIGIFERNLLQIIQGEVR